MYLQHMLDHNTMLFGQGSWVDESYDDEFGTAKRMIFRLDAFQVMTRINGSDYDITQSLPGEMLDDWRRALLKGNGILD